MTFDISLFRTQFPEFADTAEYPSQMISFWLSLATIQVQQCRWKNAWTQGLSLYIAHEITIQKQDLKASKIGGTPGVSGGIANSKTVGSVTVSYDSASTTEKDSGWWNRTTYGQQFIRLARIFGAGVVQL